MREMQIESSVTMVIPWAGVVNRLGRVSVQERAAKGRSRQL